MFVIRLITVLATFFTVYCKINIPPDNFDFSDKTKLSQCVVDIILKSDVTKTTILVDENDNEDNSLHNPVITKIAENIVKSCIPMMRLNNNVNNNDEIHKDLMVNSITVIRIKTCKPLIDLIDVSINQNNKYLILLQDTILNNCNDSIIDIATKVGGNDMTFIIEDKLMKAFKIATYFNAFDEETCVYKSNTQLTYLSVCRNDTIGNNVNVFPNKKPKNWMKCPINVGLGSLYPYNKYYNKTLQNFDVVKTADGTDIEILDIVAEYFNASLRFYHIRTDAENVRLEVSYVPLILNGSLEVCAGGLYRIYGDIVSYSGIYSNQEIIWAYVVERGEGSWITFIEKSDEVYIFLILHICYVVTCCIFDYLDNGVTSFTNTLIHAWGALFGAASLQLARSVKHRILNIFYLLLCLHLYAYVNIQLFSFLTIQGPPHIYTDTEELHEAKVPAYLVDRAKYFIDEQNYVAFANTSRSCNDFDDCIIKTLDNKGTTVLLDGLLPPLQVNTAVNGEARLLRTIEAIIVVYHEMIITKESWLVGRFENVISRLFYAGICQKLYEDSIGTLVIDKARRATQNMMTNNYRCETGCKITMSQSVGAFYAWILGCVLSCCVFFLEIIVNRQIHYVK